MMLVMLVQGPHLENQLYLSTITERSQSCEQLLSFKYVERGQLQFQINQLVLFFIPLYHCPHDMTIHRGYSLIYVLLGNYSGI